MWSGQQAAERGLIDKTGTFQDAIKASARIAGLGDSYQIEWIEPEQSALDQFFMDFMSSAVAKLDFSVSKPVNLPVSWLQAMLDDLQFITRSAGQVHRCSPLFMRAVGGLQINGLLLGRAGRSVTASARVSSSYFQSCSSMTTRSRAWFLLNILISTT